MLVRLSRQIAIAIWHAQEIQQQSAGQDPEYPIMHGQALRYTHGIDQLAPLPDNINS
jgi:hypothetical protein